MIQIEVMNICVMERKGKHYKAVIYSIYVHDITPKKVFPYKIFKKSNLKVHGVLKLVHLDHILVLLDITVDHLITYLGQRRKVYRGQISKKDSY